jgi:adenylate cyclase
MLDPDLLSAILRYQGIEYALCDAGRYILYHSPGLPGVVTMETGPKTLVGWRLEDLFDEFMGAQPSLSEGLCASEPCFRLAHVYRENLGGQPGYLTITVVGYSSGLLVMVSNTTREGDIAQRLMQQRNEMMLLQDRLKAANERLDYLLHHFVPATVARQLMTQGQLPQPGGQRRTASVLFADVRGYTMLAETIESEIVMNVLNRQFTVAGSVIAEYGGAINQYAGDQIMAIFNAPETQPDHALRAVNAALAVRAALVQFDRQTLDMRAALAQLDRQAAGDLVATVRFGFGINTGPVVVGYLGFKDRFDYTAVGDVVNVAARLSSAAHADEVLMGPQTYEAVRGHIQARPVGPLQLRGRATPVMAYEALG